MLDLIGSEFATFLSTKGSQEAIFGSSVTKHSFIISSDKSVTNRRFVTDLSWF